MVKKKVSEKRESSEKPVQKSKGIDYWMVASVVLAGILLITSVISMTSGISRSQAEKTFIDFAESEGAAGIQVVDVKSKGNIYEITFSIEGQTGEFHITKDGKYVGQMFELEPTTAPVTGQAVAEQQTQQPSGYTSEDIAKLQEFNECLADARVEVYGGDWCGITVQLVQTYGGWDAIEPIYIQCQDAARGPGKDYSLCDGITGFPTIKINGEEFRSGRSIEVLAQATGCPVPELTQTVAQATTQASC